jgi:16S rRNA (cytidine1402-2'-O)-methyltransferase
MRAKPDPINTSEGDGQPSVRAFSIQGHIFAAPQASAGLHLVATPIGNLGDITLRALQTLAGVDVIACEDSRITRRLTERYAIASRLIPYHDHNAEAARPKILQRLAQGGSVALVSDAGTPLISDPGFKLVREA